MKYFDERNSEKKIINSRVSIHARALQIWHCKIGVNIGSEEDGKGGFLRPVLIIGHIGNMLIVLPTTTNEKYSSLPFYIQIKSVDFGIKNGTNIKSFVILSQIKSIDSKRLIKHKYTIDHKELLVIKKKLADLIC
ncbi:MAG TPA: type II toxin-antitoxin system PemK/MazF family toxin [Candidatus Absconditabacterales bacterium]|nr:type II toxin-antitoxin system PemK/MazF family toxin [Candidatus Absconditabacterales bacterium]HNG97631.1 type II toxin-antitoxin system PemK/MazF family toxin [Candidatus Absconditabacterales bacterium]